MFRTLDRYVIREVLPPLFLSLLVFTFILEIPPVMDQLERLIAVGVSWGVAARMLVTLLPQALGLTIPMALLVGLLIGLGRLSNDREAVALLACGVSPYRLLRPVLLVALLAAGATMYVLIQAIPDANQTFRELSYDVVSKQVQNDVKPQVFFDNFPGWILYTRDIAPGGGWKDVLVADTHDADRPVLFMARSGELILDRARQIVVLRLRDGTRYASTGPAGKQQVETFRFPNELLVSLDPKSIFPRTDAALQRGINELTIPELQAQAAEKLKNGLPPHQEIIAIQQRFSFPFACIVFGVIGVALGLTVAREGKLAGFVVGIGVIFAYYILMYLADSLTKGYYATAAASGTLVIAHLARWVPNIILLPLGIIALIWRARWAEGRLPFRWLVKLTERAKRLLNERFPRAAPDAAARGSRLAPRAPGGRVVVVVRIPRLSWLSPTILDRYISRIYLNAAGLSFLALLGLFYIATFIDRSDKIFKGQATLGMVMKLLALQTPQYVYYVIPLTALLAVLVTFGVLSRTSELSVMKACGISLYRIAAPLLAISLAWSLVLFGLEQQVMARANERADQLDAQIRNRPPRTSHPLNRRWLVGRDGDIYHYSYFDPQRHVLDSLVIYRPSKTAWALDSETYARQAAYAGSAWQGRNGWRQEFTGKNGSWQAFAERPLTLEPPDYFEAEEPLPEMMTVPQLKQYIDDLAASGFNVVPLTVDLQRKLAFPFVTLVMTLLAIPFGMTTGRRGTLYGIGIGIVIALSYWIVGGAFTAIGKAGLLGPVLAAWAPNVIAAGSAGYLLLTART